MNSYLPRRHVFAFSLMSAALASGAQAQTVITWVGLGNGDWYNGANWDLGRAPGSNDDVVNSTSSMITLSAFAEVGSLTSTGAFTLSGYLRGSPSRSRLIQVDNDFHLSGRIEGMDVLGTSNTLMHFSGGASFDYVSFLGSTRTQGGSARIFGYSEIRGAVQSGGSEWVLWLGNSLGVGAGGTFSGTGVVRDDSIPDRNNPRPAFLLNNGTVRASGGDLALGNYVHGLGGMSGEGTWEADSGSRLILRRTSITGNGLGAKLVQNGGSIVLEGSSALYGHYRVAQAHVDGGLLNATFSDAAFNFATNGSNRIVNSTFDGPASFTGSLAVVTGLNTIKGNAQISMSDLVFQNSATPMLEVTPTGSLVGAVRMSAGSDGTRLLNNGVVRASGGTMSVELQNAYGEGSWEAAPDGELNLYGIVTGTGQGGKFTNKGGLVRVWNRVNGHFRNAEVRSEGATFEASFEKAEITGAATFRYGYFGGPTKIGQQSSYQVLGTMVMNGPVTIGENASIRLFDESQLNIEAGGSFVGTGSVSRNSLRTYLNSAGEIRSSGGNLSIGTYSNTVSGLTQADAGTVLTFDGPVTQNGGTSRAEGRLWFNYGIDLNAGRLEGGEVFGLSSIRNHGGTLAPGIGVGRMTSLYDVNFGQAATLEIDIQSIGSFDELRVGQDANLNGTLSVLGSPGTAFPQGTRFRILTTNRFVYGRFAVVPDPGQWTVHYGLNYVELEAVPEPATVVSLALGGLALLRRRRTERR